MLLFNQKIDSMLNDDRKYLKKECKRLIKSGAIDTDNYLNDYELPKIIMYVALNNLKDQRKPLYKENLKDAKNLLKF